jgi:hypothetical protein
VSALEAPLTSDGERFESRLGAALQMLPLVLFTAKCFWPGVTEATIRLAADQAADLRPTEAARFRAALLLPSDELVLCLFEGFSAEDVKRASEQAGLPCERVIDTVWIGTEGASI